MTSPQKPKPRPRPRPRNAPAASETIAPSTSKSPVEDEDAMFIRNKNRNADSWNKIIEVVDKRETSRRSSSGSDSSDSESPRTKKARRRPFIPKIKDLPAWAKSDGLIQIEDSDSEGDSALQGVATETNDADGLLAESPRPKRKRQRSRSRSSSFERQIRIAEQVGRETARQILGRNQIARDKSPVSISDDDDADEITELPPALAAIRAEVKQNATWAPRTDNSSSSGTVVALKITLKPHPEDESGRSYIYSHAMKRNEKFEKLFAEIADAGGIPSDRLVVLCHNKRVFPWSTPQTHLIWSEAELVAYEEHVYKYIKEHEHFASPANEDNIAPPSTDPTAFDASDSAAEPEVSQEKHDTFKLQVRLGESTVTVAVRQTTKCSAIVANVLRKLGKPAAAEKKARIEVDGEKLSPDSEIVEAELEDGDLIDIVGA